MPLTESERQELLHRADLLRGELSQQVARRDDAVTTASRNREDAALVAEVMNLDSQVSAATVAADQAEVSVDDAAAIMLAAARQGEVVRKTDPTGESPATSATDNTTNDGLQGKTEADRPSEKPAAKATTSKGGSN